VPTHIRTHTQAVLLALALVSAACAQDAALAPPSEPSVRPGINEKFLSEDLDVDRYVEVFEGESREIYTERSGIVAALELSPGMRVADVGAGTGVFLSAFDGAVGEQGRVYAVDISPKFLDHLRQRARDERLGSVEVVQGRADSVELPAGSVDLAFVCDTYHHFEYPSATLASLRAAIRPGGTLVVIDFERIPGESPDWVLGHVRAGKETFTQEIESAGFELERELRVEGVEENYVLRFRRR
jgi:SAM-dependent methyltransferase